MASAERSVRKLFRSLAARCRGRTVVLGAPGRLLPAAIRARGLDVTEAELPASPPLPAGGQAAAPEAASPENGLPPTRFGSAVLAGILGRISEEDCPALLGRVWSLLKPGGRLIVSVANKGCGEDACGEREFDRRTLKRVLRCLRRPRLATDQPYRWLVMYVDKPRENRPSVNRTRIDRYRETARLCRGKVIELGCGEGHLSAMIRERGLEVVGVDLSREKIERARQEHPGIAFIESDIRTVDRPDGEFDTVVLAEVLEHVGEQEGAEMLERARRLLRPGGRLIVSVPNEDCIPHPHHLRQFDRQSLKRLLLPFGKPRLVTAQPYKWLLMYVDRVA